MNRPNPSIIDYEKLVERVEGADGIAYQIWMGNKTVKHKSNTAEGAQVTAVTHD